MKQEDLLSPTHTHTSSPSEFNCSRQMELAPPRIATKEDIVNAASFLKDNMTIAFLGDSTMHQQVSLPHEFNSISPSLSLSVCLSL